MSMKRRLLLFLLLHGLSASSWAINYTLETPSPDGRFALRLDPLGVDDDSAMEAAIVNRSTQATLARLPNTLLGNYADSRLVWAPTSKRAAFTGGGKKESRTRVFFWNGKIFRESQLPTLPKPAFKFSARAGGVAPGVYTDFITPVRWLKSGSLLLSRDMTMRRESNTYEGKLLITIAFGTRHRATVRRVERSPIIVELF